MKSLELEYLNSLIKRLESFLPTTTGHTIVEVELNQQFILTKNLLVSRIDSKDGKYISYCLEKLSHLISKTIDNGGNEIKLREMNDKLLSSILIIVKIITQLIPKYWVTRKNLTTYRNSVNNFANNFEVSTNKFSDFVHFEPPLPIKNEFIPPIIDIMIKISSGDIIKRIINLIQKRPIDENKYYGVNLNELEETLDNSSINTDLSSSNYLPPQILSKHENVKLEELLMMEIDNNIEIILRFLAASNPIQYYNYLFDHFFKYHIIDDKNNQIPRTALVKYSPLIRFVFYTKDNGLKMAKCVDKTLRITKNTMWKQIILFFYANSIRDQSFARPLDYAYIVETDDEVIEVCKHIFDLTCSIFEEIPYLGISSAIQCWISILIPSDFREFDDNKKPNKLKINFNKRLKFLINLLKDSNSKSNLTCFNSLINTFQLAGRFPLILHDHPIYKFTLNYLDSTYENLNSINLLKFSSTPTLSFEITNSYDNLMINFFISAIILKPDKYLSILMNNFKQLTKDNNFRDVRIIIKIIKSLSQQENTLQSFNSIIKSIAPSLKLMIINASRLLNQYYELYNQNYSNISINSHSLSDKISLHSSSNSSNYLRRSSFDEITPTESKLSQIQEIHFEDLKIMSSSMNPTQVKDKENVSPFQNPRFLQYTEETLSDLFAIFSAVPELFFNDFKFMTLERFQDNEEHCRAKIIKFVYDNITSLKAGLQSKLSTSTIYGNSNDSHLFQSTCDLIMTIVDETNLVAKNYNEVTAYTNFLTCNYIIKSICDSCLSLSLADTKFKSNLIFLNEFLKRRDQFDKFLINNDIIANDKTHADDNVICNSVERVLLLCLCTHDIQFYNIAKETMKWYLKQSNNPIHEHLNCFKTNLHDTFEKLVDDDQIFTGFVSLHKKVRNILREAKPTKSLYQIWLIVYERWCYLLDNSNLKINSENLLLRHFTGFLVSTCGCFITDSFITDDLELKLKLQAFVSEFFDKCINLLNSQDLIVRVIIKDILSNESHSSVYKLISNKLIDEVTKFEENRISTEESTLFTEQVITILTSMISVDNEGAIILTTLLPEICLVLIKVINIIENPINATRLRLRFCRLVIVIEQNRSRILLSGAYKVRNFYAKSMCEWLEQSAFYDEIEVESQVEKSKESELLYINIDLATESSKALSLQLEELILEIPDGTSENEVAKYKDLAFANYFSLFYKILTKFTSLNSLNNQPISEFTNHLIKSKYKIQIIVENVLKCITNLLQYDTDIGLQFVFPLGYHENKKIRSLFLNVFANMLYERKMVNKSNAFDESILINIGDIYDTVRATSALASNTNNTLLANSIYGIYGYIKMLDKVFDVLLNEEINNVSRTSDIFRRNSILTKLLAKLAKDEGIGYLNIVLKDFLQDFTNKEIIFNVEKDGEYDCSNADLFMEYLTKLIDLIINSSHLMPKSFKYVCSEIYKKVSDKVPDSGLIAVGSFIFLRFFCPAIISPESFFEVDVIISNTNKKSALQLVKVIQNMANKTLTFLKWKSLNSKMDELNELNNKIFKFLKDISVFDDNEYPFEEIKELPIPELRYYHRFYFTFYKDIKISYLIGGFSDEELARRVDVIRIVDQTLKKLGQPRPLLNFSSSKDGLAVKSFDNYNLAMNPNNGLSSEYNDFMNKMSKKYSDIVLQVQVIHNAIFHDGTPVVVINLSTLRYIEFDIHLLVYKLFETASQVWDNKFYFIFDFTEFSTEMHLLITYATLLNSYAPPQLFKNCARIYYFNIPVNDIKLFINIVRPSRVEEKEARARFYTYSHCDSTEIISSLCLSDDTMSITRDKKVEFHNCKVLDSRTQTFKSSTLKIGRQFLLLCSDEFVPTNHELCATRGFRPVEIFNLIDIVRCEITKTSGSSDEFTIYLSNDSSIIIKSNERLEILRFLYFTTSRLPKNFIENDDKHFGISDISNLWFGRLFNLTFQSLLTDNEDVKTSGAALFASIANYFEIDYNISRNYAKSIAYPINSIDFIVAISDHVAKQFPHMTYRFLRAFFDSYDKISLNHRMDAILYVTPWINNICDYIYLENEQYGPDRVAGLIRHFCNISALNKSTVSVINDYIWKKLFSESILVPTLLDEIVTFAMDNRNDDPDWTFIISVITPSVEIVGEAINRLIKCVNQTTNNDSDVASESKLFEIMILVKICSSLFFDAYIYAQLFLADIFLLCTLFIDNPSLEFGGDLQKLLINTIESFLHKPDLSLDEKKVVENTLSYFTSQRAKMLFGLTREKSSSSDISQLYNRAASFEILCDNLNQFITVLGSADDRSGWRSRWSSHAIDVACIESSLFQIRGILIVGILSKSGINDGTAAKIFKLMSKNTFNNSLEYMTTVLMSASRILQGLSINSVFPSIIIWPQLYFGMLNYSSLYQASIQCLLNTLIKLYQQGDNFIERIFQQRKHLDTFITAFEDSHGFHIDEKNILVYIFFVFTQGLKLSHIKHTSLNCLKTIFGLRFDIETQGEFEVPSGILPYLFFIWLSTNDSGFEEFLETTNYKPSQWIKLDSSTSKNNYKIPKVLIDYLLSDALYSKLVLYQASFLYSTESVDGNFKTKFLFAYNYIFNINKAKGLLIYHIIKPTIDNAIVNSNSIKVVEIASDIQIRVISDKSYDFEQFSIDSDDFLQQHGLMIMKKYEFRKLSDLLQNKEDGLASRIELDNERLQEMIYRAASSYIDNHQLER